MSIGRSMGELRVVRGLREKKKKKRRRWVQDIMEGDG